MINTYNIQTVTLGTGLSTTTSSMIRFSARYEPNSTSMVFAYYFLDDADDSIVVYSGDDILGEDVLAGWGDDDQYIIHAMAAKVGVTLV